MEALNSLDFLKFGVVVCHIFPIITFHMQPEGEVFLEIARHSTNLTANGSWVCSINASPTKFHMSPFYPALYAVVSTMTTSVVGALRACGAIKTPLLMVKSGWLFAALLGSI